MGHGSEQINTGKGSPAGVVQPMPEGSGPDIIELVKNDLELRAVIGKRKYGERLKPHNGRDALVDAYQESLDLSMYLRQAIVEREEPDVGGQRT